MGKKGKAGTPPEKPKSRGGRNYVKTGGRAGAPDGNRFAAKFKTTEERQAAFSTYCAHIAKGYSDASFHNPCTVRTIMQMLKDFPEEFDDEALAIAKAKGIFRWEQIGRLGALGKVSNFNAASWIFNVKNRLGWKDKTEVGFDKDTRTVFRLNMGKSLAPATPDERK